MTDFSDEGGDSPCAAETPNPIPPPAEPWAGEVDGPMELLTTGEVAELLRVSDSWLYGAIADGRIPALRVGGPGGPIRFVRTELLAYVASCRVGPTVPVGDPGPGLSGPLPKHRPRGGNRRKRPGGER